MALQFSPACFSAPKLKGKMEVGKACGGTYPVLESRRDKRIIVPVLGS
jgi:hypothetical protein